MISMNCELYCPNKQEVLHSPTRCKRQSTLTMKLHPGIRPFLILGSWGKQIWHNYVAWHFTGISRPLPVSRLPNKDQLNTGWSSNMSVGRIAVVRRDGMHARDRILPPETPPRLMTGWFVLCWPAGALAEPCQGHQEGVYRTHHRITNQR